MGGSAARASSQLCLNAANPTVQVLKVSQQPPSRAVCIAMAQELGLYPDNPIVRLPGDGLVAKRYMTARNISFLFRQTHFSGWFKVVLLPCFVRTAKLLTIFNYANTA